MFQVKYIPKNERKKETVDGNKIENYARTLLKDERLRYNKHIDEILRYVKNGCIYLPEALCLINDKKIFNSLENELKTYKDECNIINWSKHYKIENPKNLETFNKIVDIMAKKLNVKVIETRLNYYPDETTWKPLHQDRHSTYNEKDEKIKENFTMGASFGSSRALAFKHINSETNFEIPQNNGDIFAFDSVINSNFMHGVPKVNHKVGGRFSVIAWGVKLDKKN